MEELRRLCCIRGYHVYSAVWEAAIGKESPCFNNENVCFDISWSKYFLLKIFRVFNFVVSGNYKIFLSSKILRITV